MRIIDTFRFKLRVLLGSMGSWFWCKPTTPKRRRELHRTIEVPSIPDDRLLVARLRFPKDPPRIGYDPNAITQELPSITS